MLCAGLAADKDGGPALYYVGPLFIGLSVIYFAPAFIGGVGLIRNKAWGRVVTAVLSFVLLLAIPIGTAIGAFGLWALATDKTTPVATPLPIRTMPSAERKRVLGLLAVAALVACGFIVVLGAGFRLHHEPVPTPVLGVGFYPALAVLAAGVAYIVVKQPFAQDGPRPPPLNPIWLHRYKQRMKREREAWEAERDRRIAKLRHDPATVIYADRIAAGQPWSDAQIAYDMDKARLVTCRHLQPVERAMRETGIAVKLIEPPQVHADCLIDEPALRAAFALPESVTYRQYFRGGRGEEDDPVAYLMCNVCQSTIDAVHFREARSGTPKFPQATER